LAKDFGVLKAVRATQSLIANKVDDEGVTNREGKGTRNLDILAQAENMQKDKEAALKENSAALRRKTAYSLDNLLNEDILACIPYKQTYDALTLQAEEETREEGVKDLQRLLSTFVRVSMQACF